MTVYCRKSRAVFAHRVGDGGTPEWLRREIRLERVRVSERPGEPPLYEVKRARRPVWVPAAAGDYIVRDEEFINVMDEASFLKRYETPEQHLAWARATRATLATGRNSSFGKFGGGRAAAGEKAGGAARGPGPWEENPDPGATKIVAKPAETAHDGGRNGETAR